MSQKLERREKGTGTVYQDKNGIWSGKLRYTPEPHAKQVTVNFTGKSEADIRKQIREYNKSGAQAVPNKNVTLGSYAEHWLKTFKRPNMKPSSYDKLETTYLKHVKPALGMVQPKQIKPSDIQKLIAKKKEEGYSYSTVVKVYHFFTALMEFAVGNRDLVYHSVYRVGFQSEFCVLYGNCRCLQARTTLSIACWNQCRCRYAVPIHGDRATFP